LPAARREVAGILELYPTTTEVFVGGAATEARATAAAGQVGCLHFATHALVDERSPLDSALVLAAPREPTGSADDGLLQAWEVFERMRTDAELVVLSACQTALGRELGGEGLVGLTRAFQYAGARSIVASLWNVADASTADLMGRFYAQLKAGDAKDVALQKAQLAFLLGHHEVEGSATEGAPATDLSHPYYWAAFVLIGAWD
jgi:CHAT domain-containing protein